ncbi:hypothetical protein FOCC_FOCC017731 [Frankliniella occidentalis]|nr:hypothetical protein FOCC_FOCC017731 [Frankliniella occidentalis]
MPPVLPGDDGQRRQLQLRRHGGHDHGGDSHRHPRDRQPGLHGVRAARGRILLHRVEPAHGRPVLLHRVRGHVRRRPHPPRDPDGGRVRRDTRDRHGGGHPGLRRRLRHHSLPHPEHDLHRGRPLLWQRFRHNHERQQTVLPRRPHQQHRGRVPGRRHSTGHRQPGLPPQLPTAALSDILANGTPTFPPPQKNVYTRQ